MDRTKQIELQQEFANKTWDYLCDKNVGCLNIAQRFGKTFLAGNLIKKNCIGEKVLIAYPDNQIVSSWELAFKELNIDTGNIVLTNFSSLKKHVDENWFLTIYDEIHDLAGEKELQEAIKVYDNSIYVLGMTGTLSKESETRIWDLFGMKIFLTYSAEQAIQDGIISDYQITIHKAYLDDVVKTKNKQGKLLTEKKKFDNYTFIIEKMKKEKKNFMFLALQRNSLAQKSIGKRKKCLELLKQLKDKRVLVFTGYSEQADSLGIPSFHSKSKDDNMLSFNNLEFNHLALANMGRIGKSYLNLDSIILLSWTGNEEDVFQRVSRAMLLDYKSKIADIHLICIREKSETKKLEKALSLLDQNKIKYI
jgi:superfamily II DNA or RNA helicase